MSEDRVAATKQEAVVNAARALIESWGQYASKAPEIVKREDALIEAIEDYDKAVHRAKP